MCTCEGSHTECPGNQDRMLIVRRAFYRVTLIEGVVKSLIMTGLLRIVAVFRAFTETDDELLFYANSGVKLTNLRRNLSRESLKRTRGNAEVSTLSLKFFPAARLNISGHLNEWFCSHCENCLCECSIIDVENSYRLSREWYSEIARIYFVIVSLFRLHKHDTLPTDKSRRLSISPICKLTA